METDPTRFASLTTALSKTPVSKGSGSLIVLNGTSSAGKTSVAKLLQKQLYDENLGSYLYFPLDFFEEEALPPQVTSQLEILVAELPLVVHAYSSAVAATCTAGISVIADVVFTELNWAYDFLRKTRDLKPLYVAVMCDLAQTNRREAARPDRPNGLAAYQFDRIHREIQYDLMIDTTKTDLRENVDKIVNYLKK